MGQTEGVPAIPPAVPAHAEVVVDLDAIAHNTATLCERAGRPLMAVVKADGYGHGAVASARAALAGGADALGVTTLDEARELRAAGISARMLSWLHVPGADFQWAVHHDVELGLSTADALVAAASHDRPAVVHLKIDTGLGRAGATRDAWDDLVTAAVGLHRDGAIVLRAVWSHFAFADAPGHPTVQAQKQALREAADVVRRHGVRDLELHIANSAAVLTDPSAGFDLVRPGIALYGLDPMGGEPAAYGLHPAMRLSAPVMMTKQVPAGSGVSYALTYTTAERTRLAVIPVGYADGVPRGASNAGPVQIGARRFTIAGRVCMDQFVLDLGDAQVAAGDEAVLWGDPRDGVPSVQQWADIVGTIHYELITRVGGRFRRRYTGELARRLGVSG